MQAGLRLDGPEWIAEGGDSGEVVVPGKPDESLLIQSVRYQSYKMPPSGKLSASHIAALEKWIEMGAPWPDGGRRVQAPARDADEKYDWEKFRQQHWSFRPIDRPRPAPEAGNGWARGPIDRFVFARLQSAGMAPNPPADRRTLIRRLCFDLIGLPPDPKQVEAFVQSDDPKAYEQVVDDLLASEQYGQRWARHWLDVARYSDGLGGFLDQGALPDAWRYRDWVVDALNRDMPYDEFVRRQIAGDVLEDEPDPVATGFFAVGPTYRSDGGDPEAIAQARAETLADRVDTFSRAFLGLTAACARCHDHKFDPIAIEDYYAIAGVFNNTEIGEHPLASAEVVGSFQKGHQRVKEQKAAIKRFLDEQSKATGEKDRKKVEALLSEPQKQQLADMHAELSRRQQAAPEKYDTAHVLAETGASDMHVALRGDLRKKGPLVERRFLRILSGEDPRRFTSGSGRRQLAESIVDPDNPLTARVIVNRVWQWHFGQALVRTPSNFGSLGESPTHPRLLDWLAARLIENEWSVKSLHREILLSATWQMSSQFDRDNFAKDGGNRLLWRMNPRRLEVEVWRDALLAVTGELDESLGGAPTSDIFNSRRRTLYGSISRNGDRFRSDEFLRTFDFPAPRVSSAKRSTSTTPQQYLFMLNSEFIAGRAEALADDLRTLPTDSQRIEAAYLRLYCRPVSPAELELGLAFLAQAPSSAEAWPQYAQTLLSAHEFLQIR